MLKEGVNVVGTLMLPRKQRLLVRVYLYEVQDCLMMQPTPFELSVNSQEFFFLYL